MINDEGFLMLCSFSVAFLIQGIRFWFLNITSKDRDNKIIKEIITEVRHRGMAPRGRIFYVVSFEFDNKKYDRYVETFLKSHKEGEVVTVIFNPQKVENKSEVLLDDDCNIIIPIIIIIIMTLGLLFSLATYILYIR